MLQQQCATVQPPEWWCDSNAWYQVQVEHIVLGCEKTSWRISNIISRIIEIRVQSAWYVLYLSLFCHGRVHCIGLLKVIGGKLKIDIDPWYQKMLQMNYIKNKNATFWNSARDWMEIATTKGTVPRRNGLMKMDCAHEPGAQRHNNGGRLTFRNQQLSTKTVEKTIIESTKRNCMELYNGACYPCASIHLACYSISLTFCHVGAQMLCSKLRIIQLYIWPSTTFTSWSKLVLS